MTKLLTRRTKLIAGALAAVVLSLGVLGQAWAQQQIAYPTEADKVHVVLLVFGHKGGISAACQKDCKGVRNVLETAFAEDKHRLVIHDLAAVNPATNKYYTIKETLDVIKGLKVGKNDNVLIFQSGHGAIGNKNEPEASHKLQMDGGSLTRPQIQKPIEAMNPRAIIFLTDCCSGISKKGGGEPVVEPQSMVGPNIQNIRNLVLRPIGVISITAAEDGKLAIAGSKGPNPGKAGSAFTVALLRLLYNEQTTYTCWAEFFPALSKETGLASSGRHKARAFQINEKAVIIANLPRDSGPARPSAILQQSLAGPRDLQPQRRGSNDGGQGGTD